MTGNKPTQSAPLEWMTITDIAKLAGVSVSTVSRALADNPLISEKTRKRIQEIARDNGFSINQIASNLRSRQSRTISVIIALVHEKDQHLYDPFWMTMLAHLAEALTDAGYEMLLSKLSVHEDGWLERIRRAQRPEGIILIGQSREHAAIERAAQAGCPLVVWGAKLEDQSYPTIGTDNKGGGLLAARHLIGLGYRRIAFLGDNTLPEIAQRYAGYRAALDEAGIAHDSTLVRPSGFDPGHALEAVNELIASGVAFDAIMAASDMIAISAIRALNSVGRSVPGDVAVVGFDDIQLAAFSNPPLTTIRQDIAGGARQLVDNIARVIAGEPVGSVEMPGLLIERQSALPKAAP
jgi:DNA-binding LacI/PurR family transcriptional regulator